MDTPLSVLGTPMLVVEYFLSSVSLKYPMLSLASLPHICCTTDTAWVEREVGKGGGGKDAASTVTVANMITHILNHGTFHMS